MALQPSVHMASTCTAYTPQGLALTTFRPLMSRRQSADVEPIVLYIKPFTKGVHELPAYEQGRRQTSTMVTTLDELTDRLNMCIVDGGCYNIFRRFTFRSPLSMQPTAPDSKVLSLRNTAPRRLRSLPYSCPHALPLTTPPSMGMSGIVLDKRSANSFTCRENETAGPSTAKMLSLAQHEASYLQSSVNTGNTVLPLLPGLDHDGPNHGYMTYLDLQQSYHMTGCGQAAAFLTL